MPICCLVCLLPMSVLFALPSCAHGLVGRLQMGSILTAGLVTAELICVTHIGMQQRQGRAVVLHTFGSNQAFRGGV